MKILGALKTAAYSLGANRLRAGLALLGIVIGVTAVVTLMSIGRGVQEEITASIEALGTNLLLVSSGRTPFARPRGGPSVVKPLTMADAEALVDPVMTPSVKAAVAELRTSGQIAAGGNHTGADIVGVTSEHLEVRDRSMQSGVFISPAHVSNRAEVVVLGSAMAEALFGFRDPVRQPVRINGRRFVVIGVLEPQSEVFFGQFDRQVFVPMTTAFYRLAAQRTRGEGITVEQIFVQARSSDVVDEAMKEVRTVLWLRHRITEEDDFIVSSQQDAIEALAGAANAFVIFLGAIAGISLLVGGIGIMNIMLVSVAERTREIGIRKAMGAKRRDILLQFMFEAILLTLAGGAVGVVMGLAVSKLVSGVSLGEGVTLQTVFSGDIAALAMTVSVAIGLFFGIYPASRAARLHPIEALRTE